MIGTTVATAPIGTALALPAQPENKLAAMASATTTPDLLQLWLSGLAPNSIRTYGTALHGFARWAGCDTVEAALDAFLALPGPEANAVALRYRNELMSAGKGSSTINTGLKALRAVARLARLLGRVTWTVEVPTIAAQPLRDTSGPGPGAIGLVMAYMRCRQDAKGARDRCILRLGFDLGLRRAEIVGLDLGHVDLRSRKLSVLGKGRRDRELRTLPVPTIAALEEWLRYRGSAPGALFGNFDRAGKGGRLTGRSVARILDRAGRRAGVEGRVRPHGLRHSSITAGLDLGLGVRAVQRHARHSSLETTMRYDDNREDLAGQVACAVAELVS